MNKILNYIKLIRVKHWIKNLLIYIPLTFNCEILNLDKFLMTFAGFICFCFISSAVYVLNDLNDVEKDRMHPKKKNRPIASGKVTKIEAISIIILLFISCLLINLLVIKNVLCLIIIIGYFILNVLYSLGLKNVPIVDVVILVTGFVIRIIYGANITNIAISNWLYLTVMAGSFFLGLGKRRNEIIKQGDSSRVVLKYYTKEYLDKFMYVCLVLSIVFYSLWCIDQETILRVGNNYMIYTIPLLLVIFMKYCLHIESEDFAEPVDILTSDKVLISIVLIYLILIFSIVYVL